MLCKIIYTVIILILCIIVYFRIRKNEHSFAFIAVTGIITAIIGNVFIPSGISIFDLFGPEAAVSTDTAIVASEESAAENEYETEAAEELSDHDTDTEGTDLSYLGCISVEPVLNRDEIALKLLEACRDQPEVLAATVSFFPSLLEAADVEETDPLAIEALMKESEDGGTIQRLLLGGLKILLEHPSTEYAYGIFNGTALSLGIFVKDENKETTFDNLYLDWMSLDLENASALIIVAHAVNHEPETGIFDLGTGFCPVIEFHASPAEE